MSFSYLGGSEIAKSLAERARKLRLVENISQQEFAERSGLSHGSIRRFERGETVSLDNFLRIVATLGRAHELDGFLSFEPTLSIRQMAELEQATQRKRAHRRKS
jgi:transcriptional regulator with XRE-family HTH domain